jgi:hypothetical protein
MWGLLLYGLKILIGHHEIVVWNVVVWVIYLKDLGSNFSGGSASTSKQSGSHSAFNAVCMYVCMWGGPQSGPWTATITLMQHVPGFNTREFKRPVGEPDSLLPVPKFRMESTVFWNITPCSLSEINRRLGGKYRLLSSESKNKPSKKLASSAYHLFSRWFLRGLKFNPPRWKRYVPPKRRLTFTGPHDDISQDIMLFITWFTS